MKKTIYLLTILGAIGAVVNAAAGRVAAPEAQCQMKQSVTYVHLLRKTPFFTRLDRAQLKWVVRHSTEWEVAAGTTISDRASAGDFVWVLLDGGWQIEQAGNIYRAGHADPAKWYGAPAAMLLSSDSRLVVGQHSYVMRIRRADFEEMTSKNFDFTRHLDEGRAFYQRIQ